MEGSVPPPSSQSPPARTVTGMDVMAAAETSTTSHAVAHRVAQIPATTMAVSRSGITGRPLSDEVDRSFT